MKPIVQIDWKKVDLTAGIKQAVDNGSGPTAKRLAWAIECVLSNYGIEDEPE